MVAPGKPCPLCKTPLQRRILDAVSGDEAPLRITLHGMPALSCDKPHVYFVKPDFPLWLRNHLVDEDEPTLPSGDATGLIFKSYLCHDCGKPLSPKADHLHSFHLKLAYDGEPEFHADLTMPVFRCTGCGKEQMHSLGEVRKLTPAALAHAFQAAGIKPPA
jgi:hypothetical protein